MKDQKETIMKIITRLALTLVTVISSQAAFADDCTVDVEAGDALKLQHHEN